MHAIQTYVLHGHLHFRSINQLSLFAKGSSPFVCALRTLSIALARGSADFEVSRHLMGVLKRCQRSRSLAAGQNSLVGHARAHANGDSNSSGCARVAPIAHALAQHQSAPGVHLQGLFAREGSLSLAFLGPFTELHPRSPKTFVWRGPDPEHHFSRSQRP